MADRRLIIQVIVDDSGAVSKLRGLDRGMGQIEERGKKASAALKGFGQSATSVGVKASAGLTLPITAAGAALLRAGINARESEDLFRVSFGDMAAAARAWSETTSDAMGASEFQFRESAATLFTMTQSMGVGRDAAFDMATGFVELGRDLESFFNLAEGEGFAKLRSGLVGETEPLKQLGIAFTAAEVEARALEAGLADTVKELTEADKMMARYALILERTTTAQGNAALTAESEANQLKALKAEFGDAARELGTALLPMLSDLLRIFKDMLPAVRSAVEWFGNLSPKVQALIVGGAALAAALGPVLVAFGAIASAIGAAIPIVTAIGAALGGLALGPVAAIGAAIVGLVAIWVKWGDDITRITGETIEAIRQWFVDKFGAVVNGVKEKVDKVVGFFANMKKVLVGESIVPDMISDIGFEVDRLDTIFVEKIRGQLDTVVGSFSTWAENMGGVIGGLFGPGGMFVSFAAKGMQKVADLVIGGVKKLGGAIGGFFKNLFGGPSEAELAGREVANTFIDNVVAESTVGADRVAQAVADGWDPRLAEFALAVQDMFVEAGGSADEAMEIVGLLFDSIKDGPGAVQAVIDRIFAMIAALKDANKEAEKGKANLGASGGSGGSAVTSADTGGLIQAFPRGGVVRGLGGHVPILAQPGEFVIRKAAVDSIGAGVLGAINRGGSVGGGGLTINVTGFVGPNAMNELASQINMATVRQLQRQRQL